MGNSQNIANTVWAFATLNGPAPKLFDAVAHEALERLGEFNSQDIANTVWAFATLNRPAPKLFDAVAHEALEWIGSETWVVGSDSTYGARLECKAVDNDMFKHGRV